MRLITGQGDGVDESVEPTVELVMDLPDGKPWHWLADCNVLVLSSQLTAAGRERALDEFQAAWRRNFLRSVPDTKGPCPGAA